ncbi:MAG: hydrogenase iron-sulfur subunit [Desulfarculaceae bacterium]|nr:hydrogenase iron-sulfur subunit [Desulfarculaceae bacterium]MCF8072464.1 hydrogenase iron-sulfur subunit [Desulfarculaceae bacterium]MCF8102925.1 hydrogenase iron-sulfur subunit [Desulfarculaceae bacterium]MCF8117472.1 hydrogenase iron-sulfur subunit [Desulfarculaceae bacterium]
MAEFEPLIAAFFCNWCTYGGADLAGVSRLQYPPNIRVVRLPCTGRLDPKFILAAFRQGVDGVWVSGCHPGDCHYIEGNLYARRRFTIFKKLLEYIGLEPGRLHFSWISSAEATKFQQTVIEVTEAVKALGPARRLNKMIIPGPKAALAKAGE